MRRQEERSQIVRNVRLPAGATRNVDAGRLSVTVQIATRRAGIPHSRTLSTWARAALAFGRAARARAVPLSLTIRIVGAAEGRALNRTWRGKDRPTNVLSFPSDVEIDGTAELGDLAICAPVVAREAREQGKRPQAHWAHMVVHGVLHLLGYDHESDRDAAVMEARETTILAHFGILSPYA